MANKKSQLDPATRIRNNQRRARQRQKDLIDELRQRVAEYEQRGVQASLELQQSARWVAQENHLLRALLTIKGVKEDEVKAWLAKESGFAAPEKKKKTKTCASARMDGGDTSTQARGSCAGSKTCNGRGQGSDDPIKRSYCSVKSEADRIVFSLQDNDDSSQPNHPQRRNTEGVDHASATSCIEAAEMLVAIRGQDRDQVMLSLGCKSGTDCRIKNTELLEIMDS